MRLLYRTASTAGLFHLEGEMTDVTITTQSISFVAIWPNQRAKDPGPVLS